MHVSHITDSATKVDLILRYLDTKAHGAAKKLVVTNIVTKGGKYTAPINYRLNVVVRSPTQFRVG